MLSYIKRCGAAALLLLTAVAAEPSYGQNFIPGTSPFFQVRRGLTISQYAYLWVRHPQSAPATEPPIGGDFGLAQ